MRPHHFGIGFIIAVILIFYWWHKDHPQDVRPATTGYLMMAGQGIG